MSPTQWLERINGPTRSVLVIGVGNTALILVNDFSNHISKLLAKSTAVSRKDVAKWIYEVTCLGKATHAKKAKTWF